MTLALPILNWSIYPIWTEVFSLITFLAEGDDQRQDELSYQAHSEQSHPGLSRSKRVQFKIERQRWGHDPSQVTISATSVIQMPRILANES